MKNIFKYVWINGTCLLILTVFLFGVQPLWAAKEAAKGNLDVFVIRNITKDKQEAANQPIIDPLNQFNLVRYEARLNLLRSDLGEELYNKLKESYELTSDKKWSELEKKLERISNPAWTKEQQQAKAALLCERLKNAGRLPDALSYCKLAVELDPDDSISILDYTITVVASGQLNDAEKLLNRARALINSQKDISSIAKAMSLYKISINSLEISSFLNGEISSTKQAIDDLKNIYNYSKKIENFNYGTQCDILVKLGICYGLLKDSRNEYNYYREANELINSMPINYFINYADEIYPSISVYLAERGDINKVKEFLGISMEFNLKKYNKNSINTAKLLSSAGNSFRALKKYNESIDYYKNSIKIKQKYFNDSNNEILNDALIIGSCYSELKNEEMAKKYFEKVYILSMARYGVQNFFTMQSKKGLAWAYFKLKKYEDSLQLSTELLQEGALYWGMNSVEYGEICIIYAGSLISFNRFVDARPYMKKTYSIYLKSYGPDDARTKTVEQLLKEIYQIKSPKS